MKKMKNWVLVTMMFVCASFFAQNKIMGTIQDETGPLPGANVVLEGTRQNVSSAFDGGFLIETKSTKGNLLITYLGFETKRVSFSVSNGVADLGVILLKDKGNVLGEVVIKSTVVDVAKDRKTPVAVSTIKAAEIREKLGTQEFPEILASTPSVYATKSGGGFGDSRVNIRGFSQENVAVMINGVPVNDMESGRVFWSNWAGLSDVTTAMQVQRGLGSSKLAISSVGGTINVVTRAADAKQGGTLSATIGNNDYIKTLASYSTGKLQNGLSASILLSNTQGNGYVDYTKFSGQNYYIGLGYDINDKHSLQFTFTGAPQWHNQRSNQSTIADYIKYGNGTPNLKYNPDWGMLNGEAYNTNANFYHKPVMSLNYDWKINESTKLSSVFYGSWGRGAAATTNVGRIEGYQLNNPVFRLSDGTLDMQKIYNWNSGLPVVINNTVYTRQKVNGYFMNDASTTSNHTSGISKVLSFNSHDWYGALVNVNKKISKNLAVDLGFDGRYYQGIHFQSLVDLLGANAYNGNYTAATASSGSNNDINNIAAGPVFDTYEAKPSYNPFKSYDYQKKINYNNDSFVKWYGAFGQVEYSNDKITVFAQGSASIQGFQRADYFKYKTTDPLYKTDFKNIFGFNAKGGVNYNINNRMNVFVNGGYYSKQPNFRSVYPNNQSIVNSILTNEKIAAIEAGYGYRSNRFNANLNLYHTEWKDRYDRRFINSGTVNVGGYVDFPGIHEVHDGVELDFNYAPLSFVKLNGMFSLGNWYYKGNVDANEYTVNDAFVKKSELFLNNVKVGDVAQMTAALGVTVEPVKDFKIDANYRYADKLYAGINTQNFTSATNKGALQLPSYGLLDAGFSFKTYRVKNSNDYFSFRVNVNNVLNTVYIAESRTNIFADDQIVNAPAGTTYASANRLYKGLADGNQVFFGFGRAWNFTFSYNF
ncbi:TonB-dependent receptor [Flavobacterium oreochromis]|uniref:TonB-dependent receptor n=1 Tax=Flavobacterium columnare TaxID=996 RepID=A0A246GDA2_9FLAO|nr:TonB-dependent receptor plug domain-containing protein [Flavobacterium oreochromis]OWP79296.1 TonB-dependent receptor [Flavobacterium oreochromis]